MIRVLTCRGKLTDASLVSEIGGNHSMIVPVQGLNGSTKSASSFSNGISGFTACLMDVKSLYSNVFATIECLKQFSSAILQQQTTSTQFLSNNNLISNKNIPLPSSMLGDHTYNNTHGLYPQQIFSMFSSIIYYLTARNKIPRFVFVNLRIRPGPIRGAPFPLTSH